jgi:hypothetical protein
MLIVKNCLSANYRTNSRGAQQGSGSSAAAANIYDSDALYFVVFQFSDAAHFTFVGTSGSLVQSQQLVVVEYD